MREFIAAHPRLHVEHFPAYAPEFNATEYLWGWLKCNPLAHRCADTLHQLEHDICQATTTLHTRQQLLRGFIHATSLPFRFPCS